MGIDEWSGQPLIPKEVSEAFEARAETCRREGCLPAIKSKYGRWRCPRCGMVRPTPQGENE